jgi:hypothetical protein
MPRTAKEKENNPGPKKGTHKKPPQPSEKDAITGMFRLVLCYIKILDDPPQPLSLRRTTLLQEKPL